MAFADRPDQDQGCFRNKIWIRAVPDKKYFLGNTYSEQGCSRTNKILGAHPFFVGAFQGYTLQIVCIGYRVVHRSQGLIFCARDHENWVGGLMRIYMYIKPSLPGRAERNSGVYTGFTRCPSLQGRVEDQFARLDPRVSLDTRHYRYKYKYCYCQLVSNGLKTIYRL